MNRLFIRWIRFTAVAPSLLVCSASCAHGTVPPGHLHYDIAVELDPVRQYLSTSVDLTFVSRTPELREATFLLHRDLDVASVEGENVADHDFDRVTSVEIPWMPAAGRLIVSFNKPLDRGEPTSLHFEYGGVLDSWEPWSANVFTEEWTELGLYFPWFPFNYDEYGPFTYVVNVSIDSSFQVFGMGEVEHTVRGWTLRGNRPANDIVLLAARDLKATRVESDGFEVQAVYTSLDDSAATGLAADATSILRTYSDWLGVVESRQLSLVETKREMGGGYARPGLIVLSRLAERTSPEQRADLMRYVAHEAAHFWWSLAPTSSWEDWLNESFAEYSALLMLREVFGESEYQARIAQKQSVSEDAPAIWGFDRSDNAVAERVLYSVGPAILHELAARITNARFLGWCRELLSSKAESTEQAVEVLRRLEGVEVAAWFEARLQN